jgi:hypothetical protein
MSARNREWATALVAKVQAAAAAHRDAGGTVQRLSVFDEKESRIAKLPDVNASSLTWEELTALVFQGAIFGKGREDGRWLLTYWDKQDACWCECVEETQFGEFQTALQALGEVRDPARDPTLLTRALAQDDTQRLRIVALTDASTGGKRLNAGEPGQEWLDGPTAAKKQRVEVSSNPVFATASRSQTPAQAAAASEKAAVKRLADLLSSSLKEEHLKIMADFELRRLTDNPTLAVSYTGVFGDKAKWQEHFNTRRVRLAQQQQRRRSKLLLGRAASLPRRDSRAHRASFTRAL